MCAASKASILVVDDEAAIRESLRMVLEFEGYRVEEARNGLECLQKVRERPPHAILLDLRMPEMDGSETLRALRERGYEMPVLVVSGHADVATAVEMTRRGAFDFFEKPFQSDRLLISVRNAVEARRLAEDKDGGPSGGESSILIGASPSMKRLRETIELAAPTAATVRKARAVRVAGRRAAFAAAWSAPPTSPATAPASARSPWPTRRMPAGSSHSSAAKPTRTAAIHAMTRRAPQARNEGDRPAPRNTSNPPTNAR